MLNIIVEGQQRGKDELFVGKEERGNCGQLWQWMYFNII